VVSLLWANSRAVWTSLVILVFFLAFGLIFVIAVIIGVRRVHLITVVAFLILFQRQGRDTT